MNSNKQHRSFTEAEIRAYGHGELDDARRHEMELAALDDPFLSDAMEGWDGIDGAGLVDQVREETMSNGSGKGFGLGKVLAVGAGVLVMAYAVWKISGNVEEMSEMVADAEMKSVPEESAGFIISPRQDSLDDLEIELSQNIPKEEQIDAATIVNSAPEVLEEEVLVDRTDPDELPPLESEDLDPGTIKADVAEPEHPFYHVHDLKVCDYRKIRVGDQEHLVVWDLLSQHTPADLENKDAVTESTTSSRIEVSYVDYLSAAMNDFANEEYKEALKKYRVILKKYPDDVNARFYGGLAYFNLGKMKKSATYLSVAQNHPLRVFDEEAQYYRALGLLRSDRGVEARLILDDIVEQDGFYADRARQLLR